MWDKDDWDRHVRKRRRAELVLWGVGEEEDVKKDAVIPPQVYTKQAILGNSRPVPGAPVTIQSKGMGGVEQISAGGIAKDSKAKKIRFDDGNDAGGSSIVDQRPKPNGLQAAANGNVDTPADGSKKRNRRRKTKGRVKTGVPDDDSSSDESSSSSDDEDERAPKAEPKPKALRKVSEIVISSDDSSSSDEDSDSEQ